MQKTGLKTFVYSFSVSLFAIFAANGVYLRTQPTDTNIKIPNKNITLFLKPSINNSAAPVRKITLNILPEIPSLQQDISNEKVIMADADLPIIPLEEDVKPVLTEAILPQVYPQKDEEIKLATLEPPPPVVVAEKITQPTIYSPEEPEKIAIPLEAPKSTIAKLSASQKIEQTPPETKQPKIVTNLPTPLLPLEKSSEPIFLADSIVKIGNPETLNHVATTDTNIPVNSINAEFSEEFDKPKAQKKWQSMSEKQTSDSPWLVAKANGAAQNQKLKEESFQKTIDISQKQTEGVQVATNTVQNLLIPIPEDIIEEENLVPKLSVDHNQKEDNKDDVVVAKEEQKNDISPSNNSKKGNILSSLSMMFDKKGEKDNSQSANKKPNILKSIKKKLSDTSSGKIMPKEMRLSFQPNRAEISGQTLRWVQAFATNVAKSGTTQLEIRIDGTTTTSLQQKRLNLLYNILSNKGVEEHKLNTVFTQREPNSFILRITPIKREEIVNGYNKITTTKHKQW